MALKLEALSKVYSEKVSRQIGTLSPRLVCLLSFTQVLLLYQSWQLIELNGSNYKRRHCHSVLVSHC